MEAALKTGVHCVIVFSILVMVSGCVSFQAPMPDISPLSSPIATLDRIEVIAYVSMREGGPVLLAITPDGARSHLVFQAHGDQNFDGGHISWSPVVGRLAFSAIGKDRVDIYTSLLDGSELRSVTGAFRQGGTDPVWSPNSRRLLFACTGQSPQICAINEDGSDLQDLTSVTGAQSAVLPSWSPDGRQIVYQSNRSGLPGIHMMNADGSREQRLAGGVSTLAQNARPSWSPDGKRVLFQSDRDGQWRIYAMSAAGDAVKRISNETSRSDVDAAWSLDGKKIAFRSEHIGGWRLVLASADGSEPKAVSLEKEVVLSFSWAPDSQRIAYAASTGDNVEIYIVNLVTQETINLSKNPAADMAPLWLEIRR